MFAVAPSPPALHAVARLEHVRNRPLVWLGARWHGMSLVGDDVTAGYPDFLYANCTRVEAEGASPRCTDIVEVEDDTPEPGEISTQGGCTFTTTVDGITVASFRADPQTLRIFLRGTTVYLSAYSRAEALAAARSLRGINTRSLPPRRVRIGTCKAVTTSQARPRTYAQRLREIFTIASASKLSLGISRRDAEPRVVVRQWLSDTASFPILLRGEAFRIERIRPPATVAPLQHDLVAELRRYANDVDAARAVVRSGAWQRADWTTKRQPALDAGLGRDAAAIATTVRDFRRHGFAVASPAGH